LRLFVVLNLRKSRCCSWNTILRCFVKIYERIIP